MNTSQLSALVTDKICQLLHQLSRTNKELEMAADEIDNQTLRSAVDGVSHESYQYAEELSAALHQLGLPCNELQLSLTEIQSIKPPAATEPAHEIPALCEKNEQLVTAAYQDVLANLLSVDTLKEMILYQFTGIKSSFYKLKALTQLKPSF